MAVDGVLRTHRPGRFARSALSTPSATPPVVHLTGALVAAAMHSPIRERH
jgi:hypothetical protein